MTNKDNKKKKNKNKRLLLLTIIVRLARRLGFVDTLRLPLPGLNPILLHGQRSVDAVQLVVESTGVAHGLPLVTAAPQGRGGGVAVGAGEAHTAGGGLEGGRKVIL